MTIWQLLPERGTRFAGLAYFDEADAEDDSFDTDGTAKKWITPPRVEVVLEPKRKAPKPLAEVSFVAAGSLVLTDRGVDVLGSFLSRFGQLLPLRLGERRLHFFNVTNLVDCIDVERSECIEGAVLEEAFRPDRIPLDAQVFKDPRTARARIYANDSAHDELLRLIAVNGLTGLAVEPVGIVT